MNSSTINTGLITIAFLLLFGSAELLYHKYKVRVEFTRKYVHVLTGFLTLLFPIIIQDQLFVLFLCASFLILLLLSLSFGLLPSIHSVDRKTRGSILYPIVVYTCYLIQSKYGLVFYYIPILILTLCDPVAALVGKKWPSGSYKTFGHTKTMSGSFGFFISALLLSVLLVFNMEEVHFLESLPLALCIAVVTTLAEAFTHKGYDNLTIPVVALVALWVFEIY